jgi:hypothetical protein
MPRSAIFVSSHDSSSNAALMLADARDVLCLTTITPTTVNAAATATATAAIVPAAPLDMLFRPPPPPSLAFSPSPTCVIVIRKRHKDCIISFEPPVGSGVARRVRYLCHTHTHTHTHTHARAHEVSDQSKESAERNVKVLTVITARRVHTKR